MNLKFNTCAAFDRICEEQIYKYRYNTNNIDIKHNINKTYKMYKFINKKVYNRATKKSVGRKKCDK